MSFKRIELVSKEDMRFFWRFKKLIPRDIYLHLLYTGAYPWKTLEEPSALIDAVNASDGAIAFNGDFVETRRFDNVMLYKFVSQKEKARIHISLIERMGLNFPDTYSQGDDFKVNLWYNFMSEFIKKNIKANYPFPVTPRMSMAEIVDSALYFCHSLGQRAIRHDSIFLHAIKSCKTGYFQDYQWNCLPEKMGHYYDYLSTREFRERKPFPSQALKNDIKAIMKEREFFS